MNAGIQRVLGVVSLAFLLPACGVQGDGTLTPTVAPGIPSNVRLREGNRSVTLNWEASAVGAQYTVLRSLVSGGPFFPVSVPSGFRTSTCYVDSNLLNGTSYFYQVVAENDFGKSSPSLVVSGTPHFRATMIAGANEGFDCVALLPDGSVWEWGGTATLQSSSVPLQMDGLFDITAVSSGGDHNLALSSDGRVWAWGRNGYGQIGNGEPPSNVVVAPVPVVGLSDVIAVSSASRHSLALTHDGNVWVWGANTEGQFGEGSTVSPDSSTPRVVPGLSDIVAISAAGRHNLALRKDGLLFSWGTNQWGQLGNGTTSTAAAAPSLISDLNGVVAIAAGAEVSLALRNNGTVWVCGQNYYGLVGNGSSGSLTPITVPTQVSSLTNIVAIGCGTLHTCAVRDDGSVFVWGYNSNGQVGNGTSSNTTPVAAPWKVPGVPASVQITGTNLATLALAADGSVWAWGNNQSNELGNGTGSFSVLPVGVPNITGIVGIASGAASNYALRPDGTVLGWGLNDIGMLGNGTTSPNPVITPVTASGVSTAVQIAAGNYYALALLANGNVVGWGQNLYGQIGTGSTATPVLSPTTVSVLSGITTIASGSSHNLAIRNDQTLWAWGSNILGELGNGSTATAVPTPFQVSLPSGVVAVAVGGYHNLALLTDGTLWVWGDNYYGQLGLPGLANSRTPVQLTGMTGVVAVAAGPQFSLVIKNDGTLWAWGQGDSGQLGNGFLSDSPIPIQVPGLSGVKAVAAGAQHTLALLEDGTVWSWGSNLSGQLGNPVLNMSGTPVQVTGLSGVTAIAAGAGGLALLDNQTVWNWGSNGSGQLGVPVVLFSTSPVMIPQ